MTTPNVTSNYPTDGFYSVFFMFLVLSTAFWGTKRDESLKYLTEITTKCNLFIVYKKSVS